MGLRRRLVLSRGFVFRCNTARSEGRGGSLNGYGIRELFVRPHAHDHTFFCGVNFEFSVNYKYKYWESRRITSEVRPIVGLRLHPIDIIFNPIADTPYTGGFGGLEFVPATRVACNVYDKWAVAFEEYVDVVPSTASCHGMTSSTNSGPSWIMPAKP
jgi:hypothetical protein